jgi:hypothetical protein
MRGIRWSVITTSKGRAVTPILMSASQPFAALVTLDAGPPSTIAIMCATAFSSSTTRICKGSLMIPEIELAGRGPQAAPNGCPLTKRCRVLFHPLYHGPGCRKKRQISDDVSWRAARGKALLLTCTRSTRFAPRRFSVSPLLSRKVRLERQSDRLPPRLKTSNCEGKYPRWSGIYKARRATLPKTACQRTAF